jgi:peptidoglycan/LPS O-acetylase OafA/YrhL
MFPMLLGKFWELGEFLSAGMWVPLSRLCFSAYLVHPVLIGINMLNSEAGYTLSGDILALEFLGIIAFTFCTALALSLLVESPCLALEKLLRVRTSPAK